MPWSTLKLIAGAGIVLAAFCIMLPGIFGYALRLANLAAIIIIALIVSIAAGFVIQTCKRKKNI
ncbi:MAG: hypothetical protein K2W82_13390 [Candidatus Obscuribacterales bacterium]|nr:hypothetical protein [Candidatus Obscuribacterales bacterium]